VRGEPNSRLETSENRSSLTSALVHSPYIFYKMAAASCELRATKLWLRHTKLYTIYLELRSYVFYFIQNFRI